VVQELEGDAKNVFSFLFPATFSTFLASISLNFAGGLREEVFIGFLPENNEQHVLPDFSSTTLHFLLFVLSHALKYIQTSDSRLHPYFKTNS